MFSTGKGKVCHLIQSSTSTNSFSSLLPPSVNSPHFNIILPTAPWFCRWMLYKNLSTPTGLMFIGPCIIAIVEEWKTNLMSLVILFQLLCTQHVSDINISIFRRLLKMDILMSETCWAHNNWNKITSDIKLVFHSSANRPILGAFGVYFILVLFHCPSKIKRIE